MKKILGFGIACLVFGLLSVYFNNYACAYVMIFCFVGMFASLIYEAVIQTKESYNFHKIMKPGDECWFSGGDRSFDGVIKEIDGINITVEVTVPIGRIHPMKNKIS